MPFAVAAAAVAAGGTMYAANKSSKAANAATAAQREAAGEANELSRDQFEWNKWVYENDIAPSNKANQELQFLLAEDYLDTSKQQKEFAQKQRDEYEATYLPIERQVASEALNYDKADNVSRRSGIAAANVNQQFSNAIGQRTRALGRYGLSASGGVNQLSKDSLAQAAAASGAATGAAFDTQDKAIALRSGVANFGRNMPNTAASYFAGSNNSNAGASATSNAASTATLPGAQFMNGAYNQRIGGIYDSGNAMGRANIIQANQWGQVAQGLGQMAGSAWNAAGGWGGISDKFGGLFGGSGYTVYPDGISTNNTGGSLPTRGGA